MKRQPPPMRVTPPPPSVPRLTVAHSRNWCRSPITSAESSPRYFRSCGTSPRTAWEYARFASPRVVRPFTMAWGSNTLRGPIFTLAPTTAYGPISQEGSTWAPCSMTAVGWMAISRSVTPLLRRLLAVGQHRHELALGDDLPVDDRLRRLLPDRPLLLRHLEVELEPVARDHGLAELGAVDPHQVGDLVGRLRADRHDGEQRPGLRQGLEDEDARHHGVAREVTREEGLVHRDALPGDQPPVGIELDDPVDEEEGRAVGEELLDPLDVQDHGGRGGLVVHRSSLSLSLPRSASASLRSSRSARRMSVRRSKTAELRTHATSGFAGEPATCAPGSRSCPTPDCALMTARSPMVRWPTMPDWPQQTTPIPSLVEPEIPTCDARIESGPISTLWAVWTGLSILAPRQMRVTPSVARSTQVLAPISTSSSITTIPTCGILKWRGPRPSPFMSSA